VTRCDRLARFLASRFDASLALMAPELGRHVSECAACRAVQQSEARMRAALGRLPVEEPRESALEHALAAAIRRRRRGETLPRPLWPVASVAIAAAVIAWVAAQRG
jgi:predicted anti-sigma-YlaC factor YlaD